VTSGSTLSTNDQVTILTRKDLAGFDKIATELILEMQLEGWQGFITSRGHAMMRHPDGSHQSLTRSSNRAKSGTAMRARFESWKRRRAEQEHAKTSAFGVIPDDPIDMPVPVATMLEVKNHPVVGKFVDPNRDPDDDVSGWVIGGYKQNPRQWAVFDTSNAYPVLMGHGSQVDEQGAWADLMVEHPYLFPEPKNESESEQSEQGDDMASVYRCPQCGKEFDQQRKASVHYAAAHNREEVGCTEEGCDWRGYKNMLKRHLDKEHSTHSHPCPFCGKEYTTSVGLAQHRAQKHRGQEPSYVTVSHLDVPVTSPTDDDAHEAEPPVTAGDSTVTSQPDVLLEHLEHLPEGADAEAMIAQVRSVVAGPLVRELRRLREELVLVTNERDKFQQEAADFEARLTLMREVMGV
jgi:predicted RNA-binding Zn-ribbon protein involved in translation (DUF1610 family)